MHIPREQLGNQLKERAKPHLLCCRLLSPNDKSVVARNAMRPRQKSSAEFTREVYRGAGAGRSSLGVSTWPRIAHRDGQPNIVNGNLWIKTSKQRNKQKTEPKNPRRLATHQLGNDGSGQGPTAMSCAVRNTTPGYARGAIASHALHEMPRRNTVRAETCVRALHKTVSPSPLPRDEQRGLCGPSKATRRSQLFFFFLR